MGLCPAASSEGGSHVGPTSAPTPRAPAARWWPAQGCGAPAGQASGFLMSHTFLSPLPHSRHHLYRRVQPHRRAAGHRRQGWPGRHLPAGTRGAAGSGAGGFIPQGGLLGESHLPSHSIQGWVDGRCWGGTQQVWGGGSAGSAQQMLVGCSLCPGPQRSGQDSQSQPLPRGRPPVDLPWARVSWRHPGHSWGWGSPQAGAGGSARPRDPAL